MAPLALTALGGAGEFVAGTETVAAGGRAIAARLPEPKALALLMHLVSSQELKIAEEASVKGIERVLVQERAAAAQIAQEIGKEGAEEGARLTGQAGQKAGQKILQSAAAATAAAKGYQSVKVNSNGTVTGKYTPIGSRIPVTVTCGSGKECSTN